MKTLVAMATLMLVGCGSLPGQCRDVNTGANFCVPDAGAPAEQSLTIEIADDGSDVCGTKTRACSVSRDGGTITLALTGQDCAPANPQPCPAIAQFNKARCDVGPLPAGDYTVTSPGKGSQTLRVIADGGVAGCSAATF